MKALKILHWRFWGQVEAVSLLNCQYLLCLNGIFWGNISDNNIEICDSYTIKKKFLFIIYLWNARFYQYKVHCPVYLYLNNLEFTLRSPLVLFRLTEATFIYTYERIRTKELRSVMLVKKRLDILPPAYLKNWTWSLIWSMN